MSKATCIVPWSTLAIGPDGRVNFCCDIPAPVTVNGRMGSIYTDSIDALWNAPELVELRASMARGEQHEMCGLCWTREAAGDVSRRMQLNHIYRQLSGPRAIETLADEGADTGFVLTQRPDWFILELGNVCDLKCRSCSALFSTRINADAVHHAWADFHGIERSAPSSPKRLPVVQPNTSAWYQNVEAVADMIAGDGGSNAVLSLMGGEPFLIDSTWGLLHALVDRGAASRFVVGLVTNGQHRRGDLEALATRFRGLHLTVSVDGHGSLYEYLRHGANWRKLVDNLAWFQQLSNVGLSVLPTLQNYNVLNIVPLLRFLDDRQLRVAYNILTNPARLRPTTLPPSVRRIAARRLRDYLDAECQPCNLAVVRSYCELLDEAGDSFDAALFDEFMTFTNDLDDARCERLGDVDPELVALIRAAGVPWSTARRHVASDRACSPLPLAESLDRINRTIASDDRIVDGFEQVEGGLYFKSAVNQLAEIDTQLREQGHPGLGGARAVGDIASHYGRMTRAMRALNPHAAVYACDIDPAALAFCQRELGAIPVTLGWRPDEDALPTDLDVIVCVSLLTHTPIEHWRRMLRAWVRMLHPGGVVAFTFLSDRYVDAWQAGGMPHYGTYGDSARAAAIRSLEADGFGFAALTSDYGGQPLYGVAFASVDVVRRELADAGLEILSLATEMHPLFGQDLAIARKPAAAAPPAPPNIARRDVTVIALYDPRGYSDRADVVPASNIWSRLLAAVPRRPLPTDLGFADPRVAEIRDAQAAMAREHGVDAFCYIYAWASGQRVDAPWWDLIATGRSDFPFCLMIAAEGDESIPAADASCLVDRLAAGIRHPHHVRVDERAIMLIRNVAKLAEPRAFTGALRAAAAARGLGDLFLCAVNFSSTNQPNELGFDAVLEITPSTVDYSTAVTTALTRPWTPYRSFRAVSCWRTRADQHALEWYEHWLRSTVDATRRRGDAVVFLDSWNDWPGAAYLEPDDRDGRAALLATKRATRGPGSGLVLLRQLRDELHNPSDRTRGVLEELEQVLALHEHTRDRLLSSVEVALSREQRTVHQPEKWVPVASRHLPPCESLLFLDRVQTIGHTELRQLQTPIAISQGAVGIVGWAHAGDSLPEDVDLFVALEADDRSGDLIVRIPERKLRPDVPSVYAGFPGNCGFETTIATSHLTSGVYHIAVVQRTARATYRNPTGVAIRIG
ncbi:MAG TPA: twitch domain-containing radical SAM protein [Vicinamibacterales bacterium]|nr:twitch domain-containing radical SAM protein [Vicinamibacterales bacterium]